jgi:phosphoglycerate dehydrogenase-like enzyme
MRAQLIPPAAEARLAEAARVVAPGEGGLSAEALGSLVGGARAAITGWGTPHLDEALLAAHPDLRLVAHAAGSVRQLLPLDAIESGRIEVTHAAIHIGEAVAEFVMAQIFTWLRQPLALADGMRANEPWFQLRIRLLGRLLGEQAVGLVGAGYVGRLLIRQLHAFGARVAVHDPYLDDAEAARLGVTPVTLDALLSRSDVISLHVPSLPETRHMIGAAELARIKDGALLINTARGAIIDEAALIAELGRNRITAALDVYEREPLAEDSPLRTSANAIISPHAAGHTHETYLRQGASAVDEVLRFLSRQPLTHRITSQMLATMA